MLKRKDVEVLDFEIATRRVIVSPDIRELVQTALKLFDRIEELERQLKLQQ